MNFFGPHMLMHSLFGIGLGIIIASFAPGLASLWVGIALCVIAFAVDATRKN